MKAILVWDGSVNQFYIYFWDIQPGVYYRTLEEATFALTNNDYRYHGKLGNVTLWEK